MISSIRQVGDNVGELLNASGTMASSVAQMDITIQHVEKNAAESSHIAGQVLAGAERGKSAVDATIEGMRQIRDASGATTQVVRGLEEKVENIGSILSIIDEVAEQTNLLALNAAIIAAQAGAEGRGFAVVAEEIKELADRTKVSIRQIDSVIKGIEDETRHAVNVIIRSEQVIEEGERLSRQSGEALVEIVAGVKSSAGQVDEIARAMREQAGGSQMIRKATEKVAEMIAQIVQGNREQEKGGDLIVRAADRMRDLTAQVRSSSRDQSLGGRQISLATENIVDMIGQIKVATGEQRSGSGQIIQAAENIRLSADKSLSAAQVLDQTLARLTSQVGSLRNEISRFRV
jgi:methyl-accepting chemotaxis protein